jgi:hypothetical protein
MKKLLTIFSIFLLIGTMAFAQKAEVLYFKADLACCKERACNTLENDVKSIIESHFSDSEVQFVAVKISDDANKELVAKHSAKSQTVVIAAKKRRSETIVDVSDIVRAYSRNRDKAELEKELIAKINDII